MEYTIQQVARAASTTSRTLRHYAELGLVEPSRFGHNGYRYYDDSALVRLQRVLLLRDLGLGLEAIGQVLEAQEGAEEATLLGSHRELLLAERERIGRQIAAVDRTIAALELQETTNTTRGATPLMNENIFDGFDHASHREEVERRWGQSAYADSTAWWQGLGIDGQADMKQKIQALNDAWITVADAGEEPAGERAQEVAARHVAWLREVPGTPDDFEAYLRGLADMYVADDRFAANYGGQPGAEFVRAALLAHLDG